MCSLNFLRDAAKDLIIPEELVSIHNGVRELIVEQC